MDLYEKIHTMEFSLQTICAVSIIQKIFESTGLLPRRPPLIAPDTLSVEVINSVRQLDLPLSVKEMLVGLVKPVHAEMELWYNFHPFSARPVWTPHGTVDMAQSTKAIVEDVELPTVYRYMVACSYCHERHIFEIAPLLTKAEMDRVSAEAYRHETLIGYELEKSSFDLISFWTEVYTEQIYLPSSCRHLPQEKCERGLRIGLKGPNEFAVRYFTGTKQPDGIEDLIRQTLNCWLYGDVKGLSPLAMCLLFSKIRDRLDRLPIFNEFAVRLLEKLLRWPYQKVFLDVASLLSSDISQRIFYRLLKAIAQKTVSGHRDFGYRELFIKFWEMFAGRWLSIPSWLVCQEMVVKVLFTEDEQWIGFLFSKFTAKEKGQLMLRNQRADICCELIFHGKYHLVEIFFRQCGVALPEFVMAEFMSLRDLYLINGP